MMFQLTRLREARPVLGVINKPQLVFQLTRLREARRHFQVFCVSPCVFQLTRLREARPLRKRRIPRLIVSTNAPA